MANVAENGSRQSFARAFGNQLRAFLENRDVEFAEAAVMLGLDRKKGKSRLNSYFNDSQKFDKKLKKFITTRTKPDAEILYLACTKLGFSFEYNGYHISAKTFEGSTAKPADLQSRQLELRFNRQFNLTGDRGAVRVKVDRPRGQIQLFVSLKAKAS